MQFPIRHLQHQQPHIQQEVGDFEFNAYLKCISDHLQSLYIYKGHVADSQDPPQIRSVKSIDLNDIKL